MKTFREYLAESGRGLGTHSFGMESSVGSYIKGLNAAHERFKNEANETVKTHKLKGKWEKENSQYGETHEEGSGDFAGYHTSRYTTGGSPDAVHVSHGKYDTVAHVKKVADGSYSVAAKHSARDEQNVERGHDMGVKFPDRKSALHYAVANHKKHVLRV